MDDILQIAICSGLKFSYNLSTEKKAISQCPTNVFGVFSTVKRSYTLQEWPHDIHGCIGYWTDDYKKISKKILLDKIKDVSYIYKVEKSWMISFCNYVLNYYSTAEIMLCHQALQMHNVKRGDNLMLRFYF